MNSNTPHPERQRTIRALFDAYIEMYAARDERLTTLFSDNFSGYAGSSSVLVKDREQWVRITQQDFAQVPGRIRIEMLDLSLQDLSDDVVMASAFFHIHLPQGGQLLAKEVARLVLVFRLEGADWKIVHSGISIPYRQAQEGEIYPLRSLQEENSALQALVEERTQALHESQTLYRLLTEDTRDVLWRVDRNLIVTYISPADERLRGFKAEEVVGRHVFDMFTDEGIATTKKILMKRPSPEAPGAAPGFVTFEVQHRCKDGRVIWGEILSKPDLDAQGAIVGYHGITREITQRKLLQDQVHQLAFYDPLTQLANRRLLREHLAQAMALGTRNRCVGALLFLDLDNFKPLNDAHGHGAGDLLLIEVAQRLKTCVREVDTVARFGGDEFVVLLGSLSTKPQQARAHAATVAEKIRTCLSQPYWLRGAALGAADTAIEHRCSASIGVVLFSGREASHDLIDWADAAMYQAKEDGRNLIRFHAHQPTFDGEK